MSELLEIDRILYVFQWIVEASSGERASTLDRTTMHETGFGQWLSVTVELMLSFNSNPEPISSRQTSIGIHIHKEIELRTFISTEDAAEPTNM